MNYKIGLVLMLVVLAIWIAAIVFRILLKKLDRKKHSDKYKVIDDDDDK